DHDLLERGRQDTIEHLFRDLFAALEQHFARVRFDNVTDTDRANDPAARSLAYLNSFCRVKGLQNVGIGRIGRIHRPKQRHGGELAALVDPDAERLFLGDVDLDPAATLGNDAAAVQPAIASLGLDDKVHAWGAM